MSMKSGFVVLRILFASVWAGAASPAGHQAGGSLPHPTNFFALLVRMTSQMTDADGMLFLGVCLVLISWLLRRKFFRANN